MSAHATVQELSAYLDDRLDGQDAERVRRHLEGCEDCRNRLEGMRRVVDGLHTFEAVEPPAELEKAIARRIRLEPKESMLDRFEDGLGTFQKQSSTFALFAVIIALAIMLVLFAQALERARNETIPVYFDEPPPVEAPEESESP